MPDSASGCVGSWEDIVADMESGGVGGILNDCRK